VKKIQTFEEYKSNYDKGIQKLELKIGAKKGFFGRIFDEDDWSFIIKLHALVEAACTHLLLFHFREPQLSDVIARLELSNNTIGKLAFLKSLNLLGKSNRRYIRSLSELRNSLVHDIRNTVFSLEKMVSSLSSKELKNFTLKFSPLEAAMIQIKNSALKPITTTMEELIETAKTQPKFHIWRGAHDLLVSIVHTHSYSDYIQWTKANKLFSDEDDFPL